MIAFEIYVKKCLHNKLENKIYFVHFKFFVHFVKFFYFSEVGMPCHHVHFVPFNRRSHSHYTHFQESPTISGTGISTTTPTRRSPNRRRTLARDPQRRGQDHHARSNSLAIAQFPRLLPNRQFIPVHRRRHAERSYSLHRIQLGNDKIIISPIQIGLQINKRRNCYISTFTRRLPSSMNSNDRIFFCFRFKISLL